MALGFKMITVKLKKSYTQNAFFEAIKDTEFPAGKPQMAKHGFADLIVFPALDSHNQVQIYPATMKSESNAWRVMKGEQVGLDTMVKNDLVDSLTGGFFGMRSVFGKNAKAIEKLVTQTAAQLESMGL